MEISVRELKDRLSEYLREANAGREVVVTSRGKVVARLVAPRPARNRASGDEQALALLRSQPWIRPGKGRPRVPKFVLRPRTGERTLAEIVSEERR